MCFNHIDYESNKTVNDFSCFFFQKQVLKMARSRGRPKKVVPESKKVSSSQRSVSNEISRNDTTTKNKIKKKSKTDYRNFRVYIYRVLKQIHKDRGINKKAIGIVNDLMLDVFERLAREASNLAGLRKNFGPRTTTMISSRELQSAVRLLLPGEFKRLRRYYEHYSYWSIFINESLFIFRF